MSRPAINCDGLTSPRGTAAGRWSPTTTASDDWALGARGKRTLTGDLEDT